jgi:hypothetical protein
MTADLGINDRVSESLGIAIQLKIMSEVNFLGQILSILAHGGSSVVKTLNQASFHMGWVVGFGPVIEVSLF